MGNQEKNLNSEGPEQERDSFVDEVYRSALAEHPEFNKIPEQEIKSVIKTAIAEIESLENFADREKALAVLTPEVAEKISAFWIFSGAGTYDNDKSSDKVPPAYRKYEWTWPMDRARINYAAFLTRKIAEIKSGEETSRIPKGEVAHSVPQTKEKIAEHGPALIYNGSNVQNESINTALEQPDIAMPRDTVHVVGEGIRNTLDQIKDFSLPESLHKPGNEIGLVSHAPHLMRIMHMINRHKPLPDDMSVRLFPIATAPERKKEFATMEIKGLLYYVFLSENHDATLESYPHTIHGSDVTNNYIHE